MPGQTEPDDSHLPSLSSISSNTDDAVHPHLSPRKIIIDVVSYNENYYVPPAPASQSDTATHPHQSVVPPAPASQSDTAIPPDPVSRSANPPPPATSSVV